MKKALFATFLGFLALPAFGATVVGTPHDLKATLPAGNQQTCVFCHTPHQPNSPLFAVTPLWNHTLSTISSYGVYTSPTMNAVMTGAEIGGGTTTSNLCLSCHDGTVGIGSMYNKPNNLAGTGEDTPTNAATLMTGNSMVGTNLTNDHPVNFNYDAALVTADGGLVAVGSLPSWALIGGKVQCSSCHDPHNNTNGSFLPISNVNSAVCTSCHVK